MAGLFTADLKFLTTKAQMVPPISKSMENPNTAQDILNHHLASLAADNDDGKVDHSTTTLAANIELSRN